MLHFLHPQIKTKIHVKYSIPHKYLLDLIPLKFGDITDLILN